MTIWHLSLNKSPIVSPRMPYDCRLAGAVVKMEIRRERGSFYLIYTSTFI